jgi:superfamily I DNA and/or RNA helicase
MAVITPYRDQANVLQKSVRYRFGTDFDGFTDTVHRFQGSQRPVVVVDMVAVGGRQAGAVSTRAPASHRRHAGC